MKKWNRISICLVLIVCLLLLPACKGWKTSNTGDPEQSSGQSENLQDQNLSQRNNNESASNSLVWSYDTITDYSGIKSDGSAAHRLTYDMWNTIVDFHMERHRGCSERGHCVHNTRFLCTATDYVQNTSYSEAYFEENTLILLDLRLDYNNPFSVKDVRYADGVLTCSVEIEKPIRRKIDCYWSAFVKIESALPAETQIKLEISNGQIEESEIDLNWEDAFLRLEGWALWKEDSPEIAKQLTYESCKELLDECLSRHGTCSKYCFWYSEEDGMCSYAKAVKSISYPKEFFDDHSLILVGLSSGSGSTIFEVHDLHYAKGVLTCSVDVPWASGIMGTADMASWFCFIEVDTVLPEGTEIKSDIGAVEYDQDAYMQKLGQFYEKCTP